MRNLSSRATIVSSKGSKKRLFRKNISSEMRTVSTPRSASFWNSPAMKPGDQKRMFGESAAATPSALSTRLTMLIEQNSHLNLQPSDV